MPTKLKDKFTRLIAALHKASRGNYSIRVPLSPDDEELYQIAGAVNQLLEHVEKSSEHCKNTEASLRESEERFRSLFEHSTLGIYRTTPEGEIVIANQAAIQMLGYHSLNDLRERNLEHSGFEPRYPREEFKLRLENDGQIVGLESAWLRKDGSTIYVRESARTIYDDQGNIRYYDGTFEDITDRKQAEQKIEKDLMEKELLLKEVHHRVKNNLQIICSLLNLQSGKIDNEDARTAFQYSKSRIYSMALVHEQLYRSGDFTCIQMRSYIEMLVRELERAYRLSSDVRIHLNLEDIKLGIDAAIPCGLILNELLTNAIKHAFPDISGGDINVSLSKQDLIHRISVQDNGIGLPETYDPESVDSLGLHMVRVLINQLGGELTVDVKEGTRFLIEF